MSGRRPTIAELDGGPALAPRAGPTLLSAGDLFGGVQVLAADGVVAEANGVELLEPVTDVLLGGWIVVGGDVEGLAVVLLADVAFFDEDFAGFDDVPRQREHRLLVF